MTKATHGVTFSYPFPHRTPNSYALLMSQPKIRKLVTLEEALFASFEKHYPMDGALSWFVSEALEAFIASHETSPSEAVHAAVRSVLHLDEE